jgi:hypothetical protein
MDGLNEFCKAVLGTKLGCKLGGKVRIGTGGVLLLGSDEGTPVIGAEDGLCVDGKKEGVTVLGIDVGLPGIADGEKVGRVEGTLRSVPMNIPAPSAVTTI